MNLFHGRWALLCRLSLDHFLRNKVKPQTNPSHTPKGSASADQTAAQLLTAIKAVDGGGSGLDADLLDGYNAEKTAVNNSIVKRDGTGSVKSTASTVGVSLKFSQGNNTANQLN